MNRAVDYPEALGFVGAFAEGLAELGWITGQNVRIDYRWYAGDADAARKYAAELTTLEPDIFLASGTLGVAALQSLTRSVPTVFTLVTDPVGAGFVNSLARATTTVFPALAAALVALKVDAVLATGTSFAALSRPCRKR